jgi:hypothetical protein
MLVEEAIKELKKCNPKAKLELSVIREYDDGTKIPDLYDIGFITPSNDSTDLWPVWINSGDKLTD